MLPISSDLADDLDSILCFWRQRPYCFAVGVLVAAYTLFALHLRYLTEEKRWVFPFTGLGPPSLVFGVHDLRSIWEWEVAAGHYPSARECKETCHPLSIHSLISIMQCLRTCGLPP